MIVYGCTKRQLSRKKHKRQQKKGKGLLNKIINNLPIELHIPGYQYCGPGTKLVERLARGDAGINPLDAACKTHDIAYSKNKQNLEARHQADKILAEKAWSRVHANDAKVGEKIAAWTVAKTMNLKRKFGMGIRKKRRNAEEKKMLKNHSGAERMKKKKKKKTKKVSLKHIIKMAKTSMGAPGMDGIKSVLKTAREAVKKAGGKKNIQTPRILPVPTKIGGILPFLIPIFAGLSAIGGLAGGAAGIAKAINSANAAKRELEESKRHNATMESIALGRGLYLKPYKTGMGLHLNPYPQKNQ